jgi:hypothetical protein
VSPYRRNERPEDDRACKCPDCDVHREREVTRLEFEYGRHNERADLMLFWACFIGGSVTLTMCVIYLIEAIVQ